MRCDLPAMWLVHCAAKEKGRHDWHVPLQWLPCQAMENWVVAGTAARAIYGQLWAMYVVMQCATFIAPFFWDEDAGIC